MLRPTILEEEIQVSETPTFEDKTINELVEIDPDIFHVITLTSYFVELIHYINYNSILIIVIFFREMQPQGYRCIQEGRWWFPSCTKCNKSSIQTSTEYRCIRVIGQKLNLGNLSHKQLLCRYSSEIKHFLLLIKSLPHNINGS